MNATQRKRLLKLADFIVERVPKKRFNMAQFGTMFGELDKQPCGTAGCALGWCTVLFRHIGCTVIDGMPTYKGNRTGFGLGVGLFGLTYEQSEKLFSGTKVGQSAKPVRRDILRLVAKLDKEKKPVFFSVGRGSPELAQKAKRNGWNLFSYSNGMISGDWFGDFTFKNYYRMKKATKI